MNLSVVEDITRYKCACLYSYLVSESHDTSYFILQQDFKQAYAKQFSRSSGGDKQLPFAKVFSTKLLVTVFITSVCKSTEE